MNVTSQRLLSMRSTIKRGLPLVALLVLGACGGNDSATQDTSNASDSTTAGAPVEVSYEEFCSSADANNSKLPQIESTDDAAAITTKINALAAALSDTAGKAPAEIIIVLQFNKHLNFIQYLSTQYGTVLCIIFFLKVI